MTIEDIGARLSSFGKRTKPSDREVDKIRSAYKKIMDLRSAGHTVKAIWEDLREGGLQMTHAGFKSALRRIAIESKRGQPSSVLKEFDLYRASKEFPHRWK